MKDSSFSEDALFEARLRDTCVLAQKRFSPQFIGFLDAHKYAKTREFEKNLPPDVKLYYWGGFAQASRVTAGFFPDYCEFSEELFPIAAIEIKYRKQDELTHRDFLGSFMGCGIKRDVIGDILIEDGRCVCFVSDEIADYLLSQLGRVGRTSVTCARVQLPRLPEGRGFEDISGTVASARLDCVPAAILKKSRNTVAELIAAGSVSLDFTECVNSVKNVSSGQTISVRGYGRYIIEQIGPQTKKGRLNIKAKKYL